VAKLNSAAAGAEGLDVASYELTIEGETIASGTVDV